MRSTPVIRRAGGLACLLSGVVSAGCHVAAAKVWNLEQVHEPDGTPRRVGRLRSDLWYVVDTFLERSHYAGEDLRNRGDEKIEDPLGECLENLVELGACKDDQHVVALKVASFAWLAVDCTNVLSRERCALELGPLGRELGLRELPALPAEGEAAGPDQVKTAFEALASASRASAQGTGTTADLREACASAQALVLGREGALRLLRASNVLLERDRGAPALEALRELRLELARRCMALALRQALADPDGLVRAAALESAVRVAPEQRSELLRWALTDPLEIPHRPDVAVRALALISRYGVPPAAAGEDPETALRAWQELLIEVLRGKGAWSVQVDSAAEGQLSLWTCRALSRISGRPGSLRPEVWLAWWRESSAVPAGSGAGQP